MPALLGLLLVMTLLPRFAMRGYLAMLFACELWNFLMSYSRLHRVAGLGQTESAQKITGPPEE